MRFISILSGSTICRSHDSGLANKRAISAFSGIVFPACPGFIFSHFSFGWLPISSAAFSTHGFVISTLMPSFLPASIPSVLISSWSTLYFIACENCRGAGLPKDFAVFIAHFTTSYSVSWKTVATAGKNRASPLYRPTRPGNLPNILAGAMSL